MTQAGSDSCGTCEFNTVSRGPGPTSRDDDRIFFCEIRKVVIDNPFWTYCHNHQRRNPLLVRRPRGPIMAAVSSALRTIALPERVAVIPELVPPHDLGRRQRAPYFESTRPLDSDFGECQVCAEQTQETIALRLEGQPRICFCSVAHYTEWWLDHAPDAGPYRARKPVASETLFEDLILLSGELDELSRGEGNSADAKRVIDVLGGLEGIIIQAGHGYVDLAQITAYLAAPQDIPGQLSPHLLQVLLNMAEIGEVMREEPLDWKAVRSAVQQIDKTVQRFLRGKPYQPPGRSRRFRLDSKRR